MVGVVAVVGSNWFDGLCVCVCCSVDGSVGSIRWVFFFPSVVMLGFFFFFLIWVFVPAGFW